jgi:hypothetical protein
MENFFVTYIRRPLPIVAAHASGTEVVLRGVTAVTEVSALMLQTQITIIQILIQYIHANTTTHTTHTDTKTSSLQSQSLVTKTFFCSAALILISTFFIIEVVTDAADKRGH